MKAMILKKTGNINDTSLPLEYTDIPDPVPGDKEILVKVLACGVCHTELDEIEGRTAPPELPVVPGHQVVGQVIETGDKTLNFRPGDRVGTGWIYSSCGLCEHCKSGNENLCSYFVATGRDVNGGYAEYFTVGEDFAFKIPDIFSDTEAAPLLCAGAIGYRSLKLTGLLNGQNLGLTGFGASGHLIMKMVRERFPLVRVYVFARNKSEQDFALDLGAVWAGDTADRSPEMLHSIIDTTPAWSPVVEALGNLLPGGRLVINAIRKEETDKESLLLLDYPEHLWMEKEIKSVANVSRSDIGEFLELAAVIGMRPEVEEFSLEEANKALIELKNRQIHGAKVLRIG